jgi:hypothetical protein
MTRAKRKARKPIAAEPMDLPTPEQIRNGDFERVFTNHVDSNTKAMTFRRKDSSIIETWHKQKAVGFEEPAMRAIADCVTFWARMGEPRVTANYGERMAGSTHGDGHTQQEAADEIAFRKKLVPRTYWDVFESVVRFNEPAGYAGSRFASNRPQQIASARAIVGLVANVIAMRMGY